MIEANRSYEAIRNATRRDHLLPVVAEHVYRATWRDYLAVGMFGLAFAALVLAMAVWS